MSPVGNICRIGVRGTGLMATPTVLRRTTYLRPMSKSDPLLPYKGSIIKEMYLHTADENYVVARWAHDNRLYTDFFWNSVHALEKYMKAMLLFNGHPVKGHSHGLTGLYAEVVKVAGKLLPPLLTRPANLNIHHWVDLKPEEFLERLDGNGNADNRYLTYGYAQHAWYVHMVDTMVWSIRRLALPLDDSIVPRSQLATAPTHREVLERQPTYSNHLSLPLEQIIGGGDGDARRALLNNNCAFAPDDFVHEPRASGTAGRNPVLLRRILHPLRSDQADGARHGYELASWLLSSTKQSKPVREEIQDAMRDALAKHPGIDKPKP